MKRRFNMKKVMLSLIVLISLSASAQKADTTKPKQLVLSGEVAAFESLLNAIEQSNAPHVQIEALKKWVLGQLQPQIQTTGKPK